MSGGRWMAEVRFRTPVDPDVTVTFDEFAELRSILEQCLSKACADWDEIETITITLNRSLRGRPQKGSMV